MLASLDALSALPDQTQVCCTHEYTLGNLRFARAVDPDNPALAHWQRECVARRAQGMPTLPSEMAREREINPFLRVRQPALVAAARTRSPHARTDVDVFAALRDWKNEF
jgi:hydroxyacylglutathione hydrolase